jgi:hypothetical protein
LRELEHELPGVARSKGKQPASAAEIAASLVAEIERELKDIERLRDAARELFSDRISVWEFLIGPRVAGAATDDPLSERFEDMLEEMLGAAAARARPAARRKPRRR